VLKKVYARLRSFGIGALLGNVYRAVLPYRLQYYSHCKSLFQSGSGLEIGGPSDIFGPRGSIPVYPIAANIDNCNFGGNTVWEGAIREGDTFTFNKGKASGRQYVAEASHLKDIEDSSYDFILSSHCIEHLANPLQGLSEWIRVLKENGLLVLVVPHKDGTFDHRRPVSTLEHLIRDFDIQTSEGDMTHLEEILKLHDLAIDSGSGDLQDFQDRSKRNLENRCLHHHVFDTGLAVAMVNYMGLEILAVEVFRPFHIAVIAKKVGQGQAANNEKFEGVIGAQRWRSPFPSDRLTHHKWRK
jgi:SAM-dependent methyltransferase